jgi:hypothetical protein
MARTEETLRADNLSRIPAAFLAVSSPLLCTGEADTLGALLCTDQD